MQNVTHTAKQALTFWEAVQLRAVQLFPHQVQLEPASRQAVQVL